MKLLVIFIDINPDTGFASQIKIVKQLKSERIAKALVDWYHQSDMMDDLPNRTYYYINL